MKVQLVSLSKPSLNDPILICGLPGAAFVGKFAIDHLITELAAKPLLELYSDGLPPQVVVGQDGSAALMSNGLYFWENEEGKDLIFYTADAQPTTPESEYILSEKVIDFVVEEYKSKELVTLGAYVTGAYSSSPKVYAAATDSRCARIIEDLGCTLMGGGAITGMNGLLLGMAKLKGMSGFSLLGETSGYSFDGKASGVVLKYLGKLIGVNIKPEKLEKRAIDAQEVLNAIDRTSGQRDSPTQPELKRPNYIS